MSNLLVQNIKHTNGTTAATVNSSGHVATDTIKGNASAGSISVVGEGGSNTTNLQQGLAKAWMKFNGTGLFRFPITNPMANTNYLHVGNPGPASDSYTQVALRDDAQQNSLDGRLTTSFSIRCRNHSNADDDVMDLGMGLIGDLA